LVLIIDSPNVFYSFRNSAQTSVKKFSKN
jgi:hypothetical protein